MAYVANKMGNVSFHDIVIEEPEKYDYIGRYGGSWAGEAYFPLCVYQYLPESVDRIMYLDAGDIIVTDDVGPFYNTDFDDNVIIASNIRIYDDGEPVVFFNESDLADGNKMLIILDSTFNSGSYMMNIAKMRQSGLVIDDFVAFTDMLLPLQKVNERIYFGDQGFMSACFLGDIKYWEYPERDVLICSEYNFMMGWYVNFNCLPNFKPAVVHFIGNVKPWFVEFPYDSTRFAACEKKIKLDDLFPGQAEWYLKWLQYACCVNELLK